MSTAQSLYEKIQNLAESAAKGKAEAMHMFLLLYPQLVMLAEKGSTEAQRILREDLNEVLVMIGESLAHKGKHADALKFYIHAVEQDYGLAAHRMEDYRAEEFQKDKDALKILLRFYQHQTKHGQKNRTDDICRCYDLLLGEDPSGLLHKDSDVALALDYAKWFSYSTASKREGDTGYHWCKAHLTQVDEAYRIAGFILANDQAEAVLRILSKRSSQEGYRDAVNVKILPETLGLDSKNNHYKPNLSLLNEALDVLPATLQHSNAAKSVVFKLETALKEANDGKVPEEMRVGLEELRKRVG